MSKAEKAFREAFGRIKTGNPERITAGSPVTQNNVAKEAGRDPSALRTNRYPELIAEIQAFVAIAKDRSLKKNRQRDNRSRGKDQQVKDLKCVVNRLSSIVAAQDQTIIDLLDEIDRLKEGKVEKIA